ncbi:hypothetical protein ACOMHN_058606 [Nucella lapillus]
MASGSGNGQPPEVPRGLIDRRGAPAGKGRLPSFRGFRDLTLGGVPKRAFVPNIPVRREKSAPVKIVMPVSHEKLNKLFCCHVFSDVNIVNNSWRSMKRIVERHIFVYYRSSGVTVTFTTIGVLIATHHCLKFHRHLHRCKTQQWSSEQADTKPRDKSKDRSGRGRGRGRGGRGRGRGRGASNVVQTHSIFEQAPAVQKRAPETSHFSARWGGGGGGGGGGVRKSGGGGEGSDAIKAWKFEDSGDSDTKNQGLLDVLDSNSRISNGSEEDDDLNPIPLPTVQVAEREVKKEELQPVSSTTIKQEIVDDEMPSASDEQRQQTSHSEENLPPKDKLNMQPAELLMEAHKSGEEILAFVHLPDTLPGLPLEPQKPVTPAGTSSKDAPKQEEEEEDRSSKSALRNFSEGYMGKMRIRRSGKVELVLGDHVMDVSSGVPTTALHELVTIHTETEEPSMTVLGNIMHKMVITPNFTSILQAIHSEKS